MGNSSIDDDEENHDTYIGCAQKNIAKIRQSITIFAKFDEKLFIK